MSSQWRFDIRQDAWGRWRVVLTEDYEKLFTENIEDPRYWFLSFPNRIKKAKKRLTEIARALDPDAFSEEESK